MRFRFHLNSLVINKQDYAKTAVQVIIKLGDKMWNVGQKERITFW